MTKCFNCTVFGIFGGVDSGVPACDRVVCGYIELIDLIYHFYRC